MNFKNYFKNNPINLSDKEKIAVQVGGLITSARFYATLSQSELAEKIKTKQPSIARAENGEVVASIEFLSKIAKAVNTELIIYFGFMKNSTKDEMFHENLELSTEYNKNIISPYVEKPTISYIPS